MVFVFSRCVRNALKKSRRPWAWMSWRGARPRMPFKIWSRPSRNPAIPVWTQIKRRTVRAKHHGNLKIRAKSGWNCWPRIWASTLCRIAGCRKPARLEKIFQWKAEIRNNFSMFFRSFRSWNPEEFVALWGSWGEWPGTPAKILARRSWRSRWICACRRRWSTSTTFQLVNFSGFYCQNSKSKRLTKF